MSHTSSLPAVAGLVALVGAAGAAAMSAGVAIGAVASLAAVFIVVDLIISPHVIEWIVPARTLEHDGNNYLATNALERRLAPIVTRRCADAGLPLVKVGIVRRWHAHRLHVRPITLVGAVVGVERAVRATRRR